MKSNRKKRRKKRVQRLQRVREVQRLTTVSIFMNTAGTVVALVSTVVGAILAFWSIGDLRSVRTVLEKFGNEFTLSIILTSVGTLAVILIMIKTLHAELAAYFDKTRSFGGKILEETDKNVVVDK